VKSVKCGFDMAHKFKDMQIYGTVKGGEKGQIVIPSAARKEFSIKSRDLLLVASGPRKRGIVLVKTDAVKELVGKMTRWLNESDEEV
jgi:bifunctional DNA-binding transcriptional regulator/antitoxin component of YhaV-PrlF toxin-antitoxin module